MRHGARPCATPHKGTECATVRPRQPHRGGVESARASGYTTVIWRSKASGPFGGVCGCSCCQCRVLCLMRAERKPSMAPNPPDRLADTAGDRILRAPARRQSAAASRAHRSRGTLVRNTSLQVVVARASTLARRSVRRFGLLRVVHRCLSRLGHGAPLQCQLLLVPHEIDLLHAHALPQIGLGYTSATGGSCRAETKVRG
jgi:hypothetical protein